MGSNSVLLGRPNWNPRREWIETVNDIDGYVPNFWRAVAHAPDAVAQHAQWPNTEIDLHARHAWLLQRRKTLAARLEGDPDWYNAKIAGWWVWGMSLEIGGKLCTGNGPWVRTADENGHITLQKKADKSLPGISRAIPNMGAGNGIGGKRDPVEWIRELAARMQNVRVCCGDWTRVCTYIPTTCLGLTAILLDPPYGGENERDASVYANDSLDVAGDVRAWCIENGANPLFRIALCGYQGEHEALEKGHGWSVYQWKAAGGYSNQGNKDGVDNNENRHKERIWFSPHCISGVRALPIFSNTKVVP